MLFRSMTVLEAMGGARERIRHATASGFEFDDIQPLNTIALEVVAEPEAAIIPLTSGLEDDCFEHDGQLTKREIRAVTLSSLAPLQGQLLWDIGLGAGSVAIEWLLQHPSLRAIGIEDNADRASRAARPARSALASMPIACSEGCCSSHSIATEPAPSPISQSS